MRIFLCLLFLALSLIPAHSQELTIRSFLVKTNDLTASVHERKDTNGTPCALVKVQLATDSAEFSPNVMGSVDYKVNEYWVYLPTSSQHLEVKHPNFPTKDIVFADYDIKLEPKATYILTLSLPETSSAPQMVTKQYLVFNLKPADATLEVNGETWTNTNGKCRKFVPFGNYTYTIRAAKHYTQTGTVMVNDFINKVVVNVSLKHECGSVNIPSSVSMDGATVYIDGENVGTVPLLLHDVLTGSHVLEVKKNGYWSYKKNINVQEGQTYSTGKRELSKAPNGRITFNVNGVSFDMIKVEAGTFMMGATLEMEAPLSDEKPVHQVIITNNYYLGKYEVTQALWKAVMGDNYFCIKGRNLPAEWVGWEDCQKFIAKLNRLTGKNFRLPTEAEWEFAARGGNRSRGYQYSGSDNLSDVAWYRDNSDSRTHTVGTKQPNELGIYDMSGNIEEWCQDLYDDNYYKSSTQTNPTGALIGSRYVVRGGNWNCNVRDCRSSGRNHHSDCRSNAIGLRLCLSE